MELMLVIILIVMMLLLTFLGLLFEKRDYNNGICKECGAELYRLPMDYDGERIYCCDKCGNTVYLSYKCVDRKKGE